MSGTGIGTPASDGGPAAYDYLPLAASLVEREMANNEFWVVFTDSGDGQTTHYNVPTGEIISGTLTVEQAGAILAFTTDYTNTSRTIDLVAATDEGDRLVFRYQCKLWSDDDIANCLMSAVSYWRAQFPVWTTDTSITAAGGSEYAVPADVGYIRSVDSGAAAAWRKVGTGFETFTEVIAGVLTKYVRFSRPPAGSLRLHYTVESDLGTEQTLPECGVDQRGLWPVVYWACARLLDRTVIGKVQDNAFLNAEGGQVLRLLDILRAVQSFEGLATNHARKSSSSPRGA